MIAPPAGWRVVDVERVRARVRSTASDCAAVEAPLEIRLHGQPFVVTMRTPGDDGDLALGFLLSEGVLGPTAQNASEQGAFGQGALGERALPLVTQLSDDVVDVQLFGDAAAAVPDRLARRRHVTATAACGVCGRPGAEALAFHAPPITASWTIAADTIATLPEALRTHQSVFEHTGGLHAAGVFDLEGTLMASAEDVGRHNAVDKVVGRLLREQRLPLSQHVLCVSGRASFELVQKAVLAGIAMLVAVSAPSSLAIDLARERNVTLVGFARGDGFNVYAHPQRVRVPE